MSLPALATTADLVARAPRVLDAAELARAPQLLATASNKVRAWTRQNFTLTQTVIVVPARGSEIFLAQRPVVSIDAVARMNPDGVGYTSYAAWCFNGIDRIELSGAGVVINAPAWWDDYAWTGATYRVQYTHGYTTIPDDVIDVVCEAVIRSITKPGTYGAQSEMIGGYSYRISSGLPSGGVALVDEDKEQLAHYRAKSIRTIELG